MCSNNSSLPLCVGPSGENMQRPSGDRGALLLPYVCRDCSRDRSVKKMCERRCVATVVEIGILPYSFV